MQKAIIEQARARGKFVITATQMLESMIDHPVPTRAEISDVANAVWDGTDALMLSPETARGQYAVEAVRLMATTAIEAESAISQRGLRVLPESDGVGHSGIVAELAYHAARRAGAAAIAAFTATGASARMIARFRSRVPVFAFTPNEAAARRLSVVYGVTPLLVPRVRSTDEMLSAMDSALLESAHIGLGANVVFVAGQPAGIAGRTNLIKLHTLGAAA